MNSLFTIINSNYYYDCNLYYSIEKQNYISIYTDTYIYKYINISKII